MRIHWTKGYSRQEKLAFLLGTAIPFQSDECLRWPFRKTKGGYGIFVSRKCAHRYVCEVVHGAPPLLDMEAAHECGARDCVNPRHIKWKSKKANQRDRIRHNTMLLGERNPSSKLTDAQVAEIRSLLTDAPNASRAGIVTRGKGRITQRDLAARFGVSQGHISAIRRRKKRLETPRVAT